MNHNKNKNLILTDKIITKEKQKKIERLTFQHFDANIFYLLYRVKYNILKKDALRIIWFLLLTQPFLYY